MPKVQFQGQAAARDWIYIPITKHFRADAAVDIHSRDEAEFGAARARRISLTDGDTLSGV
jgi:hypothetical protein